MNSRRLLILANLSMCASGLVFLLCAILAYGFEQYFPLFGLTLLHVAQIVLAGMFKVSYVFRLVAQRQLGLALH